MFPFNEPTPTAFYLFLYLATLVLHVLPMNYVLAGSTYLAGLSAWEAALGRRLAAQAPIASTLRDWMPFALSVAITAGVAPLLFIQILYKEPFYTANLLLFHRWMAILPVLIAAFYLLYLQKSKRLTEDRPWLRMLLSVGVLACFAFVAWSWTENHLLSTRGQAAWTEQYASGGWFYGDPELPPRLTLWYVGAFPTLAAIVAWQLAVSRPSEEAEADAAARRSLARLALSALTAAAIAAAVYGFSLPEDVRTGVFRRASAYLALGGIGAAAQVYGWATVLKRGGPPAGAPLAAISFGVLAATTGVTVAREARRLAAIDITAFYESHAQASGVGGLAVFVLFFAVNAALIAGVVVLVRRGQKRHASGSGA
ncbi:MAG: hypothetical protein AAF589_03530 [Planctomycetota bacterium]